MHAVVCGERMLTDLDFARLTTLLGQELSGALCGMLDGVDVVSPRDVPGDVVTMYSRVEIVDVHISRRQVLTVCYPCDAQPAAGFISVLSPVGSGLLGLRVRDIAKWLTPNGEMCAAQIVAIHYQPEGSGDYTR
jgi:regulator of nucleoside diphosphate kinase